MSDEHKGATSGAITPVILSGGAGSRLWPVSTDLRPKQFHVLAGERTLFEDTVGRMVDGDAVSFSPPMILCGAGHEAHVRAGLDRTGAADGRIVLEPMPRNTAPALAAAALILAETAPAALMLVMPADHVIARPEVLRAACARAAAAAAAGRIVTFGVTPDRPETGYGYIRAGETLGEGIHAVGAFREKPDLETARGYVASGEYSWNAGIFMFRASAMIDELARHAPDVLAAARAAVEAAARDADGTIRLDSAAFSRAPGISIDYAVLERTDQAAVAPVDMGWSDVGSFATLWDVAEKDAARNAVSGPVAAFDAHGCLLRSDGTPVAVIGVDDLVVVVSDRGVLVTPRDRAQDVRKASDAFKTAAHSRP